MQKLKRDYVGEEIKVKKIRRRRNLKKGGKEHGSRDRDKWN